MSESRSPTQKAPQPRHPGAATSEARREKIEKQLDEALAESFPASDPVSIVTSHYEEDWGQPESE